MIASYCGNSFYSTESNKDKVEFKKNVKFFKNTTKETISTSTSQPIRILGKPKLEDKKSSSFKDATRRHPTLKELQENKHPFPDLDFSGMLDDLLEKSAIELPEPKCPEEAMRNTDPKCHPYHRVVGHPLEKCLMHKERIIRLAREGRITLDLDETAKANHITV